VNGYAVTGFKFRNVVAQVFAGDGLNNRVHNF
jgi:hypothetical protein